MASYSRLDWCGQCIPLTVNTKDNNDSVFLHETLKGWLRKDAVVNDKMDDARGQKWNSKERSWLPWLYHICNRQQFSCAHWNIIIIALSYLYNSSCCARWERWPQNQWKVHTRRSAESVELSVGHGGSGHRKSSEFTRTTSSRSSRQRLDIPASALHLLFAPAYSSQAPPHTRSY